MALVQIRWGWFESVLIEYRLSAGLYFVRAMGERVPFRIVRGYRPEKIAPGLKDSLNEMGDTYVIAASDDMVTRLDTDTVFPGKLLIDFRPLKHISGRQPVIRDAKVTIPDEELPPVQLSRRSGARVNRAVLQPV